jgi:hypothetical protein
MVSKLNALLFGLAVSSIGDMPVSILMASARVPAMELFDLVLSLSHDQNQGNR